VAHLPVCRLDGIHAAAEDAGDSGEQMICKDCRGSGWLNGWYNPVWCGCRAGDAREREDCFLRFLIWPLLKISKPKALKW
jgi:hypothetical protein